MTEATTSLDLSVKLKEAGAPQESSDAPSYTLHYRGRGRYHVCSDLEHNEWCVVPYGRGPRAFTVGEMLQELYGLVHGVQLEFAGVGADRYVRVSFDLEQPFSDQHVDDDKDYDETFYEGKTTTPDLIAAAVGDAYYWALKHKAATPPTA